MEKEKNRFLKFISNISESGCIEWNDRGLRRGYGRFYFYGKSIPAHRASYIIWKGVDPGKNLVCHSCDNRRCVNPDHLWLGNQSDNLKDMVSKKRHHEQKKTHCKNGHEFTEENTYLENRKGRGPSRRCKVCRRSRVMKHYWKNK